MMYFCLKQINDKDKIIENHLEDTLIQVDNVYHYQKYVRQKYACFPYDYKLYNYVVYTVIINTWYKLFRY